MEKIPHWKWVIIVAVLAISAYWIYPYRQTLKPGLDLAGGTTLIYQVNIPAGSDARRDIDDTIAVLSSRIDPDGVRSLVWRPLAGNRIEIQMATASVETAKRRAAYLEARQNLLDGNISGQKLDAALRSAPADRPGLLLNLAAGNASRAAALESLAKAQHDYDEIEKPRKTLQQEVRDLQKELQSLRDDAAKRKSVENQIKLKQPDLTAQSLKALDAEAKLKAAKAAVEAFNVEPTELERILALPNKSAPDPKNRNGPEINPRDQGIDQLAAAHPVRAQEIRDVAARYAEYEVLKGPLDDPNDLIDLLRSSGVLEFRIAATEQTPNVEQFREQLATRGPRIASGAAYAWLPVDDLSGWAQTPEEVDAAKADPASFFARRGLVAAGYANRIYLLLGNAHDNSMTHVSDSWQLTGAYPTSDERGFPAVSFNLDTMGGSLMSALTTPHQHEQMAIVLDGKVMSAPNLNSAISSSGQITGGRSGFSPKELDYLIRTLKAGALKARLSDNPISIQKIGSQFGQDNLAAGVKAAVATLIIVWIFMAGYYFVCGVIADIALASNIIITLGLMAFTNSTFTLPGIAGIILTIGMAVDANVLVFERIREELDRKVPVRTAIRLGYSKVMATIIDTHLTTLLTCLILYYLGTADVKGFAVTLGIGLLASFFTAVYSSHVLLEIWIKLTNAQTLGMLPLNFPAIHRFFTPNIDWYGKRYLFVGISLVLTVGGMIGIGLRGRDFFDIEFRSGTEVGFQIRDDKPPMELKEVRRRLDEESQRLADQLKKERGGLSEKLAAAGANDKAAIEEKIKVVDDQAQEATYLAGDRATIVTVGETKGTSARSFSIATLATDTKFVTDALKDAFQDVLSAERPVGYAGMDLHDPQAPYVFAVRKLDLGDSIARPDVHYEVPSEYMGGVAIVLKDLQPAQTIKSLNGRISNTLMQAEFEELGYHDFELVGLDAAPVEDGGATQPASVEPRYKSVVLLAHDEQINYAQNPDTLTDKGGLADTEWHVVNAALRRDTSFDSVSNFSSQISGTMQSQAIVAVLAGWAVMLIYIWFRFGDLRFGVGAVLALIHDVITAIGLAALAYYVYDTAIGQALLLQPFRVNLALVAAALTLIGYSVNDTIVVFDRIRENRGKLTVLTPALINDSINQTISRTVLTAGTVLIACFCLYVLGGEAVRGFAFVMLIGSLVGCYSSIAVASPLLLVWVKKPASDKAPAGARPASAGK